MMTVLTSVVVALALLFGGTGAAVYAAQDSLPDDQLYSLKMLSEDSRLSLAGDPQNRLEMALNYSSRRVTEVQQMVQNGKGIPEGVVERLQQQTMLALQIAANLDDRDMIQALDRVRERLQEQDRLMEKIHMTDPGQQGPVLGQIRETLRERLRLVEVGLSEPQAFRERVRKGSGERPTEPPAGPSNTNEPDRGGYGPGPEDGQTSEPGSGYGPGPLASQTPSSGGGYGPGPQSGQTSEPNGGGYGPGPLATQTPSSVGGYGPGPQASQTAEPGGGGYGPGPQASQTPEPDGDGYGPGPQASQTAEPGGGYGPGPNSVDCTATPQMDGDGGGGGGDGNGADGGDGSSGGDGGNRNEAGGGGSGK